MSNRYLQHLSKPRLAVVTSGLRKVATLTALLDDAEIIRRRFWQLGDSGCDGVLAWGQKSSAAVAQRRAIRWGVPLIRLEDGFLRSVGLGNQDAPLSIVIDRVGIYYDANHPSQLEDLVAEALTPDKRDRALALRRSWQHFSLSKYNHSRISAGEKILTKGYVLVVDQTAGDISIRLGKANKKSFHDMLDAALRECPTSPVVVKVHPDVTQGRRKGHYDLARLRAHPRITVLDDDVSPAQLLENAIVVYVVTSQMGFEALLWGKSVRVFGMPFYAGWGLTCDELSAPGRRRPVSIEQLIYAALVAYPRYINPETGFRCEIEDLMVWLDFQRQERERRPLHVSAHGFSSWKRPLVRRFLAGASIKFSCWPLPVGKKLPLAVWGCRYDALPRLSATPPGSILRLEDGFLRSVGLGAQRVEPLSWVVDSQGIYYDATRPSSLETLLQIGLFSEEALLRATALRYRIVESGVSKYNLPVRPWLRPSNALRVILIVGQVETDASIAYATNLIKSNVDLAKAVRRLRPDAYLIYKPHPDVVAKLRRAGRLEHTVGDHVHEVLETASIDELLASVDEVHVLTSLTGFEALLRGKHVVTYGQPFYAGWGLTTDLDLPDSVRARRTRRVTLDEMVAATFLEYPTYIHPRSKAYTSAEGAVEALIEMRKSQLPMRRVSRWQAFINRWLWFV